MTMSCAKARGVGFVVLVVLLVSSLPAQEPRRVACVGDSITEGSANADARRNSWPLILGRELEVVRPGGFRVANFGSSGATLARRGPKPYREQEVYEKSLAFEPDVVVINLGTNDAVLKTWEVVGPDFAQDLRDLVGVYRALPSRPQVWLSRLTPMFDHHPRFLECQPGRAEVDAVLDAVAAELGLEVIDLGRGLEGRPLLCPDGLHPNTAGNALIAAAVQRALVGEDALPDRSLRPRPVKGEVLGLVEKGRALRAIATGFSAGEHGIEGRGPEAFLEAGVSLAAGDFHLRARLRMLRQENSAAAFHLGDDVFGFEGARGRAFRNGPNMGGLRLLHPSELLWEREAWIDFEVVRNDGTVWFLVDGQIVDMALVSGPVARFGFSPMRSTMQVASWTVVGETRARRPAHLVARTWDL
ncbi:MAG: hypothetical protein KDB53_13535, partial [Planctomycetes bacterium]|nr:hypothetical protein [Planctomycetota bacterium]